MSFLEITQKLFEGFGMTCLLFVLTLVFAIPLGFVVMAGSTSKFKPLAAVTRIFVWIIRGTPLMLQIFVVFYVPSLAFNIRFDSRELAVLVAFVINYACYFSEIYRGGIESVPKGQYEAGAVLGMTKKQVFFKVILLQVVKRIMPPMSNEIITLVKDTSLSRVIGVVELIFSSEMILSGNGLVWPLFYAGAFYLVFNGILTVLFNFIEKKLSYFKV